MNIIMRNDEKLNQIGIKMEKNHVRQKDINLSAQILFSWDDKNEYDVYDLQNDLIDFFFSSNTIFN